MLVFAFFSVYELLLIFFRNWVGSHKKYRFLNFLNRFFTGCLQGKMSVLPNIYLYKLKHTWFALRFSVTRRKLQPPFSWIRETTFVFVLSWLFLQLCLVSYVKNLWYGFLDTSWQVSREFRQQELCNIFRFQIVC